jgi:hypothetical protein
VDLSGIIFVVLAVVWAVYLIPKTLRHHDEVARTRSIDRFSTATRVLAHREPVYRGDSRLVVDPPRSEDRPTGPVAASRGSVAPARPGVERTEGRRTAARVAARRRRRILMFLLLCDVLTAAASYLGYLRPWAVAVPGGLTLVYLVLCRTQVRRESAHDVTGLAERSGADETAASSVADGVEPVAGVDPVQPVDEHGVTDVDQTEDTIGIAVADLQAELAAPAVPAAATGTLWDPLPVTLPTYVTKPRARRTVRTIDLGEPGTWTSGRTAEDAEIVARASGTRATEGGSSEGGSTEGGQRAVGT